ncbi:MAG: aminomethyl-transferring glycine dehydrogenase subunit GcvPB [Chloroflexi bacterium]|nr:aminomethyl-transferring glycine dehydrogenase subunit GcvPB [Chloroflexota bacterium]
MKVGAVPKSEQARRRRLLMDASQPGRVGSTLPDLDVPAARLPPKALLRSDLPLPEVSEPEVVRYFTYLSRLNYGVDSGFYPLGSCTMKYNPKRHEDIARQPGCAQVHPLQPEATVQGALQLMYELQGMLQEVTGLAACTLAPAAGAQGELTGMMVTRAYHLSREDTQRRVVLVPDAAHGTNPASAAMCGFQVATVSSDPRGNVDLGALGRLVTPEVAAIMLTMPNTLGLFDPNILQVCELVHRHGGLVYGDGANMNALLGQVKLGELGFDIVHLNLHKTFSSPHGGGGPGAGPICVSTSLAPFLPSPVVELRDGRYRLATPEHSTGRLSAFSGNFGVLLRAYCYIRTLGEAGLRQASQDAVLNANYIRSLLRTAYHLPYDRTCLHEVVFSASRQRASGVKALDVCKRLIDYGFHPPTMYFPLVVEEALMIEPTETEDKETLDAFIAAMRAIAREADTDPDVVRSAPHDTPNTRLDEARAARQPDLRWRPQA